MVASVAERFEIMRELGRGSRGVVYLATDRKAGRDVALKVFPPSIQEFQNEVGILTHLHNPFLAEIYDFGFDSEQKRYFLAEEYFAGEPLSRWAGRLSFQQVAEITAHLCQVLQFLHHHGVFHGDLKPSNILISENGAPNIKLVDFGLAGQFRATEGQLMTSLVPGTISGTIPYMAPELFMGAPVDGRSDLYSLGATLYELVGGQPPFTGHDAATLIEKHLFEMPRNPVPAGSLTPKEFGLLVLKLLHKDPAGRFDEANDLIRAVNLQFHFTFPLGPEQPVLSPELTDALKKKHVERLYEWAIPYYSERSDPASRRFLAEIYYRQGKWDEAERLLEGLTGARVQLLLLQIGLQHGQLEWVRNAGTALLAEPFEMGQRGSLLNTIGGALYHLGQYAESETAFREALACFEQAGDQAARASLLNNFGNLHLRGKQWDKAKGYYEQGLAVSRETGDFQNEGLSLMSLGCLAHARGNTDEALPLLQQGEAILEAIGYGPGVAKVKCELANLLIATGALEKGEEKLRQAEVMVLKSGDHFLVAYSRLLAGDLLKQKGESGEAVAAYREAKRQFAALKCRHETTLIEQRVHGLEEGAAAPSEPPEGLSREGEKPLAPLTQRVFEINRQISLLQDTDQVLAMIIDSLIEFTGAERGYLILREAGANVVKATRGMDDGALDTSPEGYSSSLVEHVCASGVPIITIDATSDERFSQSHSIQQLKLRSIICIPFHYREAVIGALYLENRLQRAAFSETDIPLLQAFGDQAAIAISNAWIFQELKKSAADIGELNHRLQAALSEKETELHRVRDTLASQQAALELKYRYDEIVGRSPPMMEVFKLLDRVTDVDVPVFLFGESGTGKELIARAIHFNGPRARQPFVPVNCSAIPETLLEAELFGYARGAFTGAERDHEGVFAAAQGGTLFLDEIGDMPLTMQAKLLRVLEDRIFKPLGSPNEVQVDIRILTASNKDVKELVQKKLFREDLYFRIHQLRIALPPLRERKEDLPLLVDHFLEKIAREKGGEKKGISRGAFELLATYAWPGNIRELEHTIGNACLLAEGPKIRPEDLRQKEELVTKGGLQPTTADEARALDDSLVAFEETLVRRALQQCHGNVSQTAKSLRIARPRLYRLIRKFQITMQEFQ